MSKSGKRMRGCDVLKILETMSDTDDDDDDNGDGNSDLEPSANLPSETEDHVSNAESFHSSSDDDSSATDGLAARSVQPQQGRG